MQVPRQFLFAQWAWMNVNKLRQVVFFKHMKISMSAVVKNESAHVQRVMLILWIADLN